MEQFWETWSKMEQVWETWSKMEQFWKKHGPKRNNFGKHGPKWSNFGKHGPKWNNFVLQGIQPLPPYPRSLKHTCREAFFLICIVLQLTFLISISVRHFE